jgi:hypothetical protein
LSSSFVMVIFLYCCLFLLSYPAEVLNIIHLFLSIIFITFSSLFISSLYSETSLCVSTLNSLIIYPIIFWN